MVFEVQMCSDVKLITFQRSSKIAYSIFTFFFFFKSRKNFIESNTAQATGMNNLVS